MALVLNTNSYVTVETADLYFETRIDSATWFDASDEIKEQALVTATQIVDDHAWIGSAVSPLQALAWPRKNALYYDTRLGMDVSISETTVPDRVSIAVYEQALHLINNEDLLTGKTQTYESISIGNISLSDSNNDVTRVPVKPAILVKTIKPLLSIPQGNSWWRNN
jgi:hypothetical protein